MLQLTSIHSYFMEQVSESTAAGVLTSVTSTSTTSDENDMNQPPLKRFKRLSMDIEAHSSSDNQAACLSSVDDELVAYLSASKSYCDQNGLNFWIKSEQTFPLLAPLAEDIICCPASEAYVERVFSVCGDLTSGKRNRLSKQLENRTFLKMNCKFYD